MYPGYGTRAVTQGGSHFIKISDHGLLQGYDPGPGRLGCYTAVNSLYFS